MHVTNTLKPVTHMVCARTDVMKDVARQCRLLLCQPQAQAEEEQTTKSRVKDMGCVLTRSSWLVLAPEAKIFMTWQIEKLLSIATKQDVQQ